MYLTVIGPTELISVFGSVGDPEPDPHVFGSVADPGCLSRIPDPTFFHPGSELSPSRIPVPHQRI
jgi:hypothetical protein